ncbi:MAG: LacI family DNA-binding transcriptional regulator [Lachnospiraceae bacterium]|nr:LacI family DNA-binding transcriptional regulator [Lachnospiraceae bacterium]
MMNISEFAQIAGVSKSAVSRYFNDGYLSEDKRERIEAAIAQTGYAPNIAARAVRTRVTKLVGVILPKLSSESCARVTEGISEVLNREGYKILLINTANDAHQEIESLELLRQNRVDGIILLATVFTDLHKSVLSKVRVPIVLVGQQLKGFNCICHNDEEVAYTLTRRMLQNGAKHPALIGVLQEDRAAGAARRAGFEKALEEFGMTCDPRMMETAQFTMDSGYDCMRRIVSRRQIPDAVFCATDDIAAGAMLCLRENGLRVPEDVMVCGVGDSKIARILYTPLTTARLHHKTAGIEAANMLLSAIRSKSVVPRSLQLGYDVIERQSTQQTELKYETV